jgi:hypothetical protein
LHQSVDQKKEKAKIKEVSGSAKKDKPLLGEIGRVVEAIEGDQQDNQGKDERKEQKKFRRKAYIPEPNLPIEKEGE